MLELKDIALNYICGGTVHYDDERWSLSREQVTHCLSRARDELLHQAELMPAGGQSSDPDGGLSDEVDMSHTLASCR